MNNIETDKNIEKIFAIEIQKIFDALKFENYRDVENIIDKVQNVDFTRYCVTLLVDELISFETEQYNDEI